MSISSAQASQDRPNVLDFKPMLDAVDVVLGDAARPVELHEPRFGARERELVLDCIDTNWVSSAGKYVTRFEEMVAEATGSRHAVAIVNGTAANDSIAIASGAAGVTVNGLATRVTVAGGEGALDSLTVNGLGGNDSINASNLKAGLINLTINGGAGDDTIIGSQGNDTVNGGQGSDVARLGAGDDSFVWNPGDGSDTVNGQAGTIRCSSTVPISPRPSTSRPTARMPV